MVRVKKVLIALVFLVLGNYQVLSQSLSINAVRSLDFGNEIFPGIEKTVLFTDPDAAFYEISGEANRQIQISFQLPSSLEDELSNDLQTYFGSTNSGYNQSEADPMGAVVFDPKAGTTAFLNNEGILYVWIGATVTPLHTQPGNTYQGDLILDITYTN